MPESFARKKYPSASSETPAEVWHLQGSGNGLAGLARPVADGNVRLHALRLGPGAADLEGRLHVLDYDKKFLLKSADNLTFDGSSIRGFSQQSESDLRLAIDWPAMYWLPSDVFGPGKVLVFADVLEKDGSPYIADLRSRLKQWTDKRFANASDDFRFSAAVALFGMILRDSPYAGDATMRDVITIATGSCGEDPHGYRAEFVTLAQTAESLKTPALGYR